MHRQVSRRQALAATICAWRRANDPATGAADSSCVDRGEALRDLRQRRLTLGLSQASVAAATGVSRSLVGRIERDELGSPDLGDMGAIAAALGLRLRIGIYPDGQPIADGVQLRLLAHLGRQLHPGLRWRMEVPLPISGDLRAWDAVVSSDDDRAGIEGISRLGAVDATVRRVLQKQRDDARIRSVVLVVADTVRNRDCHRHGGQIVLRDSFPLDSAAVMRDLRRGRIPRLNGIVLLRVPRARMSEHQRPRGGERRRSSTGCPQRGKTVDGLAHAGAKFVDKPVGAAAPGP